MATIPYILKIPEESPSDGLKYLYGDDIKKAIKVAKKDNKSNILLNLFQAF